MKGLEEVKGRTETGTATGTERAGQQGQNEEGNGERGVGREQGGQRGQRRKTEPRWSGMCKHMGRPISGTVLIRFGTITSVTDVTVEAALREVSQANTDLGIFQETKLTDGIYTRGSARYSVVATDASSRHRDGVEIFQLPAPHFVVEEVQQFGPNVIE